MLEAHDRRRMGPGSLLGWALTASGSTPLITLAISSSNTVASSLRHANGIGRRDISGGVGGLIRVIAPAGGGNAPSGSS